MARLALQWRNEFIFFSSIFFSLNHPVSECPAPLAEFRFRKPFAANGLLLTLTEMAYNLTSYA